MSAPLVFVHGLGGSALNWARLSPLLSSAGVGSAIDLAGFGLRPPTGRGSTTVQANAALVRRHLVEEIGEPAILVGNSMGGMISILVAAADPSLVRGLVLINPTLPQAPGVKVDPLVRKQFLVQLVPGLGEVIMRRRIERVPARRRIEFTLSLCCADPSRIPDSYVEEMVALEEQRATVQPDRAGSHLAASRSMLKVLGRPAAYRVQMDAISAPVLLLHGWHDRLVPIGNARAAAARRPQWSFIELDAGHIPHMETPELVAAEIVTWLAKV